MERYVRIEKIDKDYPFGICYCCMKNIIGLSKEIILYNYKSPGFDERGRVIKTINAVCDLCIDCYNRKIIGYEI